jgi:hypothetical protein
MRVNHQRRAILKIPANFWMVKSAKKNSTGEESVAIEINLNHLISGNFNPSALNPNAEGNFEISLLKKIQNKLD